MYFKGADGLLNWDQLPNMALYRGHMANNLSGTSNGGATTHAFGWKVDGLGSFGKDGDGTANPPTDKFINSLAGFQGSIMRQAANAGIPVGVVNDGHIGEPGTGVFLSEVGNRNNWQEITRQMIQGRPNFNDAAPWVIMGGGEADTRPSGTPLLHRNHNQERGQPLNAQTSLRADALDLELDWDNNGSGVVNGPIGTDDWIVIKTRAQFEALKVALMTNASYAPRVLGLFAYQDLFNDRNEEDLIARNKITTDPVNYVGPLTGSGPGFRSKASRIVLWGDGDPAQPGYNPPTFKEMTEVAITILDRAAKQQTNPANRRFFLVAEQEANDNFGNNDNAVGMLQALHDTDEAIGVARNYVASNPRTLILTAADSDAGGLQLLTPYRNTILQCRGATEGGAVINTTPVNNEWPNYGLFGTVTSNPAFGGSSQPNMPDGIEGRGANTPRSAVPPNTPPPADLAAGSRSFLSEADANGKCHDFAIAWPGTADYGGGILSRAAGLNAGLLNSVFAARFDNIDVYRMMHLTLFGNLLNYPAPTNPQPGIGLR